MYSRKEHYSILECFATHKPSGGCPVQKPRIQPIKQYTIIGYNLQQSKRRKRKKLLAVLLIVILIFTGVLLIVSAFRGKQEIFSLFYTKTPTVTATNTPTATPSYTDTPTPTVTPLYTDTPTVTPMPEGPFLYTVEEGDNCWYLAVDKFGVDFNVFMAINNFKDCNIKPGDQITIPAKNQTLPQN